MFESQATHQIETRGVMFARFVILISVRYDPQTDEAEWSCGMLQVTGSKSPTLDTGVKRSREFKVYAA